MQSHRQQPTRLPCPWDSPGNTGVGCHFLLQCMKVKREREVAQLCLTLRDPMDCRLPGSSIHGIFQAKEYWSGVPLGPSKIVCPAPEFQSCAAQLTSTEAPPSAELNSSSSELHDLMHPTGEVFMICHRGCMFLLAINKWISHKLHIERLCQVL